MDSLKKKEEWKVSILGMWGAGTIFPFGPSTLSRFPVRPRADHCSDVVTGGRLRCEHQTAAHCLPDKTIY